MLLMCFCLLYSSHGFASIKLSRILNISTSLMITLCLARYVSSGVTFEILARMHGLLAS